MDPRAVVPDLLVDVGVALWRGEAAEFRCPGHGSPSGQPSADDQKVADSSARRVLRR